LAARVSAKADITMTPAAIHWKTRFPLNSGQANAVKTKPGLGGDTVGLPKFPPE
jgi:hypothetical protein